MIPVPATQTQADMWSELDGGRGNKAYVIGGPEEGDDDPTADELHPVNEWGTCPVCGEIAACAVDINGDPMRHVATGRTD